MNTEYDNRFQVMIVLPLRRVIGSLLRAVNYYVLWGEFNPETANACGGCQGVHLIFDEGEVELDWGAEQAFRSGDDGMIYHLIASSHSTRRGQLREWIDDDVSGLGLMPAGGTRLWKGLIGQPLTRVQVLGWRLDEARCSPQAARLYFPSTSVIIAIGMARADDRPQDVVGDGDDLLVFSEQAWATLHGVPGIASLICCWDWPSDGGPWEQ